MFVVTEGIAVGLGIRFIRLERVDWSKKGRDIRGLE